MLRTGARELLLPQGSSLRPRIILGAAGSRTTMFPGPHVRRFLIRLSRGSRTCSFCCYEMFAFTCCTALRTILAIGAHRGMLCSQLKHRALMEGVLHGSLSVLGQTEGKSNPGTPDFKHKITLESLWIDSSFNPQDMLEKTKSARKGMHKAKAQELSESSISEMLSLEDVFTYLEQLPRPFSVENLTWILHNCRKTKNIAYARCLYAHMCKSGLEAHRSLGNYLVPILVEVQNLCDAQQVFNRLVYRNEHSWTSLITGYVECGESQHALNLYQKMQEDGVHPSGHTFVVLLKACARLKDVKRGQKLHSEICRMGLERNLFVGNTLVSMYAKCGLLAKAQQVFDKLLVRDVVSWSALIAAYVEHEYGVKALDCFKQMHLEGIPPNVVTFICSLKACGSIGAIDKGVEIHAEIVREGLLEVDVCVGNALVNMYAKCGSISKARKVFDELPARNVVSWTALIAGYAEHGLAEEALNCFECMQLDGVSPDALTSACSLKACGSVRDIDKGREIHAVITKKGFLEKDPCVGNALIGMYSKCGLLAKAREVFDELPVRDVVSWTALIAAYVEHGFGEEALHCFEQMQLDGVSPNIVTFVCSLKACANIGAIHKGQEIHAEISRKLCSKRHPFVGSALVDMYAKCGLLTKAREVFDELPIRDVVPWTALIAAYAEHGYSDDGLNCFKQMQLEGVSPNAVTFTCSLKACGSIGAIDKGEEIHAEVAREGMHERDPCVGNALVDMYAKCGELAKARDVFDNLPDRDVVSWTALMAGYAHLGESENVFHMLERMRGEGFEPNGITFLSILAVCSHTGLVGKGQKYFEAMSKDYGITPSIEHHTCMVDLLGRAGQLDEVLAMLKNMPFCPNLVLCHTVMGACQKWGNVELGQQVFQHALQLDDKDPAAYVLMSNIYVDDDM